MQERGFANEERRAGFHAAAYGPLRYSAIVIGISLKTMANYVDHAANTPMDAAFSSRLFDTSARTCGSMDI